MATDSTGDQIFHKRLLHNTQAFVFEAVGLVLKLESLGFDDARLLFSILYHWNQINLFEFDKGKVVEGSLFNTQSF